MITLEQIEEVKNKLVANYQPDKIILFGSYARGDANEYSDLDIMVLKSGLENINPIQRFSDALVAIRGPRSAKGILKGISLDLIVMTPQELEELNTPHNWFISSVLKEGRVIYAGNNSRAVA